MAWTRQIDGCVEHGGGPAGAVQVERALTGWLLNGN